MYFTATLLLSMSALAAQGPVLGIGGEHFTLDGKPAFMLGCSYYGALGAEKETILESDLDALSEKGFNWIRVWATWNFEGDNVSAVAPNGKARPPYKERLERICALAGARGMVVDVTITRGKQPMPETQREHLAVIKALAEWLLPYRNVYIDVGNERDVGDARHVPEAEVAELIAAIKRIDPERLCTASSNPAPKKAAAYIRESQVDFLAPHLSRTAASPAQTEDAVRALRKAVATLPTPVPVLLQEPFRRGYNTWQPKAADFMTDLKGALEGGAAGWCFHNGSTREAEGQRPRRSFDLHEAEGTLFEQLDAEELKFIGELPELKARLASWPE